MPEEHFNGLTPAEAERLVILAEEASEVVHACMKILRHGYEDHDPNKEPTETNRCALERELGNFGNALSMMGRAGDVGMLNIAREAEVKSRSRNYLHHQ